MVTTAPGVPSPKASPLQGKLLTSDAQSVLLSVVDPAHPQVLILHQRPQSRRPRGSASLSLRTPGSVPLACRPGSRRWPAFHAAKAQRALYFYQAIYQAIYKSPRFPLPIEITSSGEDRKTDLEEVEARATPLEPSSKPHASFQLFLPVGAVGTVLTTSCGQCHTLPPHNKTQCPHLG